MQPHSEVTGNRFGSVGAAADEQVIGLGGICAQIVEFAFGARSRDQWCDCMSGWAFLDIPRQVQ
jgi:hypothetical protein